MEDGIWDGKKKNDGIIGVWGAGGLPPWKEKFGITLPPRSSTDGIRISVYHRETRGIELYWKFHSKIQSSRFRGFKRRSIVCLAQLYIFLGQPTVSMYLYTVICSLNEVENWISNCKQLMGHFTGNLYVSAVVEFRVVSLYRKKHVFTSHSQHKHYLLLLSINRYFWSHYKKNDAIVLLITHWKIGTHSQIVCVGMLWVRKLLYTCQMDKSPGFMRYKSTKYICTSAQAVALIFSERTLITRMIKQHVSRHSGDKTRIQLKDALLS